MKSVGEKLKELEALYKSGEGELSEWEEGFITSVTRYVKNRGDDTTVLSGKQVDKIEQLWSIHCE